MSNRLILPIYAAVFFGLTSTYENYRDNLVLVLLAIIVITFGGLIAWLLSIRGKN
tara:strand:+ start:1274 stop:1438 length:165 start_codon:yes stop_codon:yes gene_type:complete